MKKKTFSVTLIIMGLNSVCWADEFSLEGLRFFYTPDERNPMAAQSPESAELPSPVVKTQSLPAKKPVSIRYIGIMRSQNRQRLFWKKGHRHISSTVSPTRDKGLSDGAATPQTASQGK